MTTDKTTTVPNTSTSTTYTYTWPPHFQGESGWLCPRCNRVNAPWVRQCDCSNNTWTPTWTDGKWWKTQITCGKADANTFGSSDYYDKTTNTYSNVVNNCSNCKEK